MENVENTEEMVRLETPETPSDKARSDDKAGDEDEVGSDDEVGNPSPATAPQARLHGSEPTETTQNLPFFNQKPTPEASHDVGLNTMQMVGVPISRSNLCGVLGVFRTVCVLCVMLRFRSSVVRAPTSFGVR